MMPTVPEHLFILQVDIVRPNSLRFLIHGSSLDKPFDLTGTCPHSEAGEVNIPCVMECLLSIFPSLVGGQTDGFDFRYHFDDVGGSKFNVIFRDCMSSRYLPGALAPDWQKDIVMYAHEILETMIDAYSQYYSAAARDIDEQIDSHSPIVQLDTIDLALYKALERDPELLKTMDWRKFEELLADILKTFNYDVELMCGTKDGGIDVVAIARSGPLGPHKYILQAKRWSNSVGVSPVERLLFTKGRVGATKACLATTAEFTSGAWKLARKYPWQLELVDYKGLRDWIEDAIAIKTARYLGSGDGS